MRVDFSRALLSMLASAGCASSSGGVDASTGPDAPGNTPGMPGVGAHGMHWYHLGQDPNRDSATSISTPAMDVQATGSTIVVSVGRGSLGAFDLLGAVPTDNKGNSPYQQVDETHKYDAWPSGTALYTFPAARGGSGFRVTTSTDDNDEITIAAVEVTGAGRIQQYAWNQVADSPNTSKSVTTTGPATLVAFWWGDGFPHDPQNATPNNGFTRIDTNAQERDSFVQCAVAVKNVSAAGTYDVSWTPEPAQGAQLWLVAVQK
jgi:hypothetical protein